MSTAEWISAEWCLLREFGVRHWIAHLLMRAADTVKDTTYYQAVRIPGGSRLLVAGNAWGGGCLYGVHIQDGPDDVDDDRGWPVQREFDDIAAALDWIGDEP